jgi:hypothetical protein
MGKRKTKFRMALIILIAVSVVVCPFLLGARELRYASHAGNERQITFTPHVVPLELTQTAEGLLLGIVIPVPTLGPGQYFEEDDPNRPDPKKVLITSFGDDFFGYGRIRDTNNLYLVWVSDRDGTHYLIIDGNAPGFMDPARTDEFSDLIADMSSKQQAVLEKMAELQRERAAGRDYFFYSMLSGTIGLGCLISGQLQCSVPAGIAFFSFLGLGRTRNNDANAIDAELDSLMVSLGRINENLRGTFEILASAQQPP